MKVGLKLWSTNDFYINPSLELFRDNIFDYIELYVVPDSIKFLTLWESLKIPFILHAPHSLSGVNAAQEKCKNNNFNCFSQVDQYRDVLNPELIIFHPGLSGSIKETILQFCEIGIQFPEIHKKMLVENMPRFSLIGEECIGSTVNEVTEIIDKTGVGFCFDIGHAICAANASGCDWRKTFADFVEIQPKMLHLSDGNIYSEKDSHLNYGEGNFPMSEILNLLKEDVTISIETKKCSDTDLDDFQKDAEQLKRYLIKPFTNKN